MRIQLNWGPHGNSLDLEATEKELPAVATHLETTCAGRGQPVVQLDINLKLVPLVRQLLEHHLSYKFGLIENFDADKKAVSASLVYKSEGWATHG